jgi:zeta-carotene isomerase
MITAVATVLSILFYVWVYDGGLQWGNQFKDLMEGLAGGDTTFAITYMLGFFALAHSGLASLRPLGEQVVGERAWRVLFAMVSLPLAFSSIVYFINHR